MNDENKRQAATLAIGVSNQLITASLAMLPILGAVLIFVLDKRSVTLCGWLCFAFSFVFFLGSIWSGSQGIAAIYAKGDSGEWSYLKGDPYFQWQFLFSLLGLLFSVASIIVIGPTPVDSEAIILRSSVKKLEKEINFLKEKNSLIKEKMELLDRRTDSLFMSRKNIYFIK